MIFVETTCSYIALCHLHSGCTQSTSVKKVGKILQFWCALHAVAIHMETGPALDRMGCSRIILSFNPWQYVDVIIDLSQQEVATDLSQKTQCLDRKGRCKRHVWQEPWL